MASSNSIKQKNRSLLTKTVNDFYVSFFKMPENESNILGRQIKSIERPNLTFQQYQIEYKGVKQYGNGRIDFAPISVTFEDDENSLATRALYYQLYRQSGQKAPSFENSEFEMSVKAYNASQEVVEEFKLKNCFISTINHSENVYSDSTGNIISISVVFDTVEYTFPDYDTETTITYLIDETGTFLVDEQGNKILG